MLVIGFSFVACGGDDDSGGSGGGGGGGGISGGTVTYPDGIANADKPTDFSFVPNSLTVNYPLSSRINEPASVTISGGKLTIKLGIPFKYLISAERFFDDDVTVTPSGVKLSPLDGSFCTVDQEYYLLCVKGNSYTGLFYVDNDVTVRGTHPDSKGTDIYNVSLKKGWNYYYAESYDKATKTTTWASSVSLPSGYTWTVMDKDTYKQFND